MYRSEVARSRFCRHNRSIISSRLTISLGRENETEQASLLSINDAFRKIIIVNSNSFWLQRAGHSYALPFRLPARSGKNFELIICDLKYIGDELWQIYQKSNAIK